MLGNAVFEDLLEQIGSDAVSPGSGVAAAGALALGIACLRKAVSVSRRHTPEDARLEEADARLCGLLDRALAAGQADSLGFPRLAASSAEEEKAAAAEDLVALADRVTWICAQLTAEAARLAPIVQPNMANDVLAAQMQAEAAAAIAKANGAENNEVLS